MNHNSEDEQALRRIQHDWADARLKRNSSFPKQIEADDFTVVWPDGQIINKQDDVKSYEADGAVFSEFKITDLDVRFYGETAICGRARMGLRDIRQQRIWAAGMLGQTLS